jgi:serine/threonine protein phosphatase PrpC
MGYMSEGSNLSLLVKTQPPPTAVACHADAEKESNTGSSPRLKDFMAIRRPPSTSSTQQLPSQSERLVHAATMKPPCSTLGSTSGGSYDHEDNRKLPAVNFSNTFSTDVDYDDDHHRPLSLPQFRHPGISMWTAAHAANSPSEDRSSSLVNVLLQPLPLDLDDSETQLLPPTDYKSLIRLNLWSVIDGHGGGAVATYASEVLLPHIAASISRALGCSIVDRGVCTVNGQLRDANALDLDGLIKTTDRSLIDCPNSIHYQSPYEQNLNKGNEAEEVEENDAVSGTDGERKQIASLVASGVATLEGSSEDASMKASRKESGDGTVRQMSLAPDDSQMDASVSSAKTSVKTAASPANQQELIGTHSPKEVAAITRAITESFLAVDEAWINSIDPIATHQNSCQSNGRWNSGACALVVFTIQRLDWTSVSEPDKDKDKACPEKSRRFNSVANRDAARRRMADYAAKTKSASSMSTVSSTSSLTTEEAGNNASEIESEITETEGEDDRSYYSDARKRVSSRGAIRDANRFKESLISPPGGCSCHCYRAHDVNLYTAHVGDCRAVMLGSAPPRTIKVRNNEDEHPDTTDDESSHHSSDETECLSSSDHDADSSEEEDVEPPAAVSVGTGSTTSNGSASFVPFPSRVTRKRSSRRRAADDGSSLYVALPPLIAGEKTKPVEFDFETEISRRERQPVSEKDSNPSVSSSSSGDSLDVLPLVHLPSVVRPIDLTTDHSAYNPAEVTAVLRRCNNAPRAISAGVGGGIKRVAGSLAVTRALGDAYLKTPLLSFVPYKSHAPYITGRPEVNCRPLVKDADKVLILATDGVWERASGDDVLRWVRNFYEERIAELERRNNRRMNSQQDCKGSSNDDVAECGDCDNMKEASDRDLFERSDDVLPFAASLPRKRPAGEQRRSPSPPVKRRKRSRNRISYNVADVIVRRVLNKVRRARNISSLQALMSLPPGRARRSKHDDITASVVDLSAFIS